MMTESWNTRAYQWDRDDHRRFDAAMEELDFTGLEKWEIIANSLENSVDVAEEDDPVGCSISTAKEYIDQRCSSF